MGHDGSVPVRLKLGTRQWYTPGSSVSDRWTYVRVKVKNLDFAKRVRIGFQREEGGWAEEDLGWIAHFGSYDLFGASLRPPSSRFYVRYSVAGAHHYDSNLGADYRVGDFDGLVGGHVVLSHAEARQAVSGGALQSWMQGRIYVNNLSYNKKVGTVFTYDDWHTVRTALASYAGAAQEGSAISLVRGVEVWTFETPHVADALVSQYRFAVFHENLDAGTTHWDNNFTQDFSLPKADGSRLE